MKRKQNNHYYNVVNSNYKPHAFQALELAKLCPPWVSLVKLFQTIYEKHRKAIPKGKGRNHKYFFMRQAVIDEVKQHLTNIRSVVYGPF